MTAEALSPPDPMQSLRERLIQDGSIVPEKNFQNLRDKARDALSKLIFIHTGEEDGLRRSYLEHAISILEARFRLLDSELNSEIISRKPVLVWELDFSLLIYKIKNEIRSLFGRGKSKNRSLFSAKNGFYSPLKENMKNTP